MGWFDSIFGDDTNDQPELHNPRDPLGRLPPEPEFDAFRRAWKGVSSLFDLFGGEPLKLKQPVGPDAPNRRPDVAKVETFLGRTGHLDLAKTDGPTSYYGSRVDRGIRRFQKDNALRVDGLINPGGPTLQRIGATLSENLAGRVRSFSPLPKPAVQVPALRRASSTSSPYEITNHPVVREGRERIPTLVENRPAVFKVRNNPDADASDPWYVSSSADRTAVATFETLIDQEAHSQKVDPDIIKAIMFAENARGHYWGAAKVAEGLGAARTIFPMNIDPEIWALLGTSKNKAADPRTNIRVGVTIIKRLAERLEDPSPEKIATVYNSPFKEMVTDYGAYVGRAYREKPWLR